jgi:hypothetical protein
MKLFAAFAIAFLLVGCSTLPRLSFQTKYGTFSYELPEPTSLKK